MNEQIRSLANRIKVNREQDDKFVIMLGAGASISSGVPPTGEIMGTLLERFGGDIQGDSTKRRFDQLWARTTKTERETWLKPYLDKPPSPGYGRLAQLIDAGYFDILLTFNFDNLLEKALRAAGFADYKVIIRGETKEDEMQELVLGREPRCKLLKLHGSVQSSHHFLFDADEMFQYPPAIESLIQALTGRHIIICGYAFRDDCVIRAFASKGESIVSVDLAGVPERLRPLLRLRNSESFAIRAGFDEFFAELYRELVEPPPPARREKPPPNPFKFLESYGVGDRDALMKREEETKEFFDLLSRTAPPDVIVIAGPETSGKTSLVRAGLEPRLDATRYRGVYLRCQDDLGHTLSPALSVGQPGNQEPLAVPTALRRIAEQHPQGRTVLFLDQFERVTGRFPLNSRAGIKGLQAFIKAELLPEAYPNLTIVLVVTDEDSAGGMLYKEVHEAGRETGLVQCFPLDKQHVAEIIATLAQQAGLEFDPKIIQELAQRYEPAHRAGSQDPFTLAHVQAVCHILAGMPKMDYHTFKRVFENNLQALNQAINANKIISFVENFPWPDSAWLRNIIKVPLKESKDQIAKFIREHYEELLPGTSAPGKGRQGAGRAG